VTASQAIAALVAALVAFVSGGALQRIVERWSKARATAVVLEAKTEQAEANAIHETLRDLRKRLDDCERKHDEQRERGHRQDEQLAMMQRQIDADAVLIERLAAKAEADETLIRGMRAELDELRRVMRGATPLRKVD